ncbi:COP9 signalosome [Trametes meyenii]|nr:COP9 signalosome [Trametes meyenii]
MTGPPTPPPSSAVEIEDAARTVLPPQVAASTLGATEPPAAEPIEPAPDAAHASPAENSKQSTTYELLFPSISDLARSGSLRELIEVAERGDLSGEYHADPSRLYLVAPLVLAYLIVDELSQARHALTRLPDNLTSFDLSKGLLHLLAATSERKYPAIYQYAEALHQFVLQPAFSDAGLGQILAGMITSFVEAFRTKTFKLLSRAYTSIPLSRAQSYLGYPPEQSQEVLNAAMASNWKFDQNTQILIPTPQPANSARGFGYMQSTLQAFTLVTDSVANLEARP